MFAAPMNPGAALIVKYLARIYQQMLIVSQIVYHIIVAIGLLESGL